MNKLLTATKQTERGGRHFWRGRGELNTSSANSTCHPPRGQIVGCGREKGGGGTVPRGRKSANVSQNVTRRWANKTTEKWTWNRLLGGAGKWNKNENLTTLPSGPCLADCCFCPVWVLFPLSSWLHISQSLFGSHSFEKDTLYNYAHKKIFLI